MLDELEEVLARKFVVTPRVKTFIRTLRSQVELVTPEALPSPVCRDRDDDLVLGTAMAAGADRIVTGDRDLLVLRRHENIELVTPREFLEWLDGGTAKSPRKG